MKNIVKKLISEGNLQDAISNMLNSTEYSSIYSSIVIISGRYNALKEKDRNGELSFLEKNIEENKLRASLIDLLEESDKKNSITGRSSSITSSFSNLFVGLYFTAIIAIVIFIFISHNLINESNKEINNEIGSVLSTYVKNGKIYDANEQYQDLLLKYPYNDSLQFMSRIISIYTDTTKDVQSKFAELFEESKRQPIDPTLNFLLGNLSSAIGRDDDAIRYYNSTLFIDTSFAVAYLHKGISLQKLGEFRFSLEALEIANRLTNEWNTSALSNIINLYYVFDRHEDVINYAQKANTIETFFEPNLFMALSNRIMSEYDYSLLIMDTLLRKLETPDFIKNENNHMYFYNVNNNGLTPVIIYIVTIEDKKALLIANKTLTYFIKNDLIKMKECFFEFKSADISASKKEEIATFLYLYEVQNLVRNKIITLEQEKEYLAILKSELNI